MKTEDFQLGEYSVHPSLNAVEANGTETAVESKAMEVLVFLASRPAEVISKESILRAVWPDTFVTDDVLTHAISHLRKVLDDDATRPRYIQTIPRRGYRLVAPIVRDVHEPARSPAALPTEPVRASRVTAAVLVVAVGAGIGIGMVLMRWFQVAPPAPVVSAIKLEAGQWLGGIFSPDSLQRPTRTDVALSRDGRFIVYSAVRENPDPGKDKPRLYLRWLDRMEAKPIAGTEGGIAPFLSPDDRWVGFWSITQRWKLMKVPVDGGVPTLLYDAKSTPFGAAWGDGARIVFSSGQRSGLSLISAEGSKPEALTVPDKTREEVSHRLPHCLPGGKGVLFTVMRHVLDNETRVAVLDLQTGRWRYVLEDAVDARYVPSGHLVFLRRGTLMTVRFDPGTKTVVGQPLPVVENVLQALNLGNADLHSAAAQFSISDRGSLIYAQGAIVPDRPGSLVWVDHQGNVDPIAPFNAAFAPVLAADGERIALVTTGTNRALWVYDIPRRTPTLVARDGLFISPLWTLDGTALVYGWCRSGVMNLYRQPVDGSSAIEKLVTSEFEQLPASWSPDGATLALTEWHPGDTHYDITLLDLGTRRTRPFLNSPANERYPYISPDGRWLAYTSDETGQHETYVRSFPDGAHRWRISNEGGVEPGWSPDGSKLFYRRRHQWWVVDIRTQGDFSPGSPRLLFEKSRLGFGITLRAWDVSRDGKRFLVVQAGERKNEPVTELILVQNYALRY